MTDVSQFREQLHRYVEQLSPRGLPVAIDVLSYLVEREKNDATETVNPVTVEEIAHLTTSETDTGQGIDLPSLGIDRRQAALLRASLSAFSEDWDSPEMSIYDRYDAHQSES